MSKGIGAYSKLISKENIEADKSQTDDFHRDILRLLGCFSLSLVLQQGQ